MNRFTRVFATRLPAARSLISPGLALALGLPLAACAPDDAPDGTSASKAPVASERGAIIDGTPARQNQILSTLALVDPGSGEFFCTGTLVAPTVVVTAAHCLMNGAQDGFINADDAAIGVDVLDARRVPANKRVDIERFSIHPGFAQNPQSGDPSSLGRDDDIAVVVLSRPVDALPTTPILPGQLMGSLADGSTLTISGYGVNDLRTEDAGVLHIGETTQVRRTEHEILAGGGNDADTCFGDSGGPAYLTVEGTRYLVGATSRGAIDSDVDCGDRGIYTLVPAYQDWIDEVVNGGPAADAPPPNLQGAPGVDGGGDGGDWPEDGGEWDGEGDGEDGVDVCAEEGWYDDGVCDPFCDQPDADCEGEGGQGPDGQEPGAEEPGDFPAGEGDGEDGVDVCAEEGFYDDGVCDDWCDRPDADCEGIDGGEDLGDEDFTDEDLGDEDLGDEDFGDEDFGDEDLGDEDFGDEDLGDEDLGDEDFGDEDLGDEDLDDLSGTEEPGAAGEDEEPAHPLDGIAAGCSATSASTPNGAGGWALLAGLLGLARVRRRWSVSSDEK